MEIVRRLVAPCEPSALFVHVADLEAYAAWMPLVHDVDTEPDAEPPAWSVELRATVGPFARSKRLRMVRTDHRVDERAVFERAEIDGRRHSPWILRAELAPADRDGAGPATELTMTLHYGGSLWSGAVLQRVLDDQVARGSTNLLAIVAGAADA